jgi:hypothetical protein
MDPDSTATPLPETMKVPRGWNPFYAGLRPRVKPTNAYRVESLPLPQKDTETIMFEKVFEALAAMAEHGKAVETFLADGGNIVKSAEAVFKHPNVASLLDAVVPLIPELEADWVTLKQAFTPPAPVAMTVPAEVTAPTEPTF